MVTIIKTTTIRISQNTKDMLDTLKLIPRETYDAVIERLLKDIKDVVK